MGLSALEWHARYRQQAAWTAEVRSYLFERAGLRQARRVIEVGCGTGAVMAELGRTTRAGLYGLDLNQGYLTLARRHASGARLTMGDAQRLPYRAGAFDLALCHFLLLWVQSPLRVIQEMARVTCSGGAVLALAEPDYGGRIDYPEALAALGAWQSQSLRGQGADPRIGRQLRGLFTQAGLQAVEAGVIGGRWAGPPSAQTLEGEWAVLRADLQGAVPEDRLQQLYESDRAASGRGERILYVPTFYAWGRVPG